jgi:hypothetical protein
MFAEGVISYTQSVIDRRTSAYYIGDTRPKPSFINTGYGYSGVAEYIAEAVLCNFSLGGSVIQIGYSIP